MLWVLKRTVSKHMIKLMDKKKFIILRSKIYLCKSLKFNLFYVYMYNIVSVQDTSSMYSVNLQCCCTGKRCEPTTVRGRTYYKCVTGMNNLVYNCYQLLNCDGTAVDISTNTSKVG